MAQVTRGQALESLNKELGIQSIEPTATRVGTVISPTFDVGEKHCTHILFQNKTTTGTTGITFCPSARHRPYITHVILDVGIDAAFNGTYIRVQGTLNGSNVSIIQVALTTGAATDKTVKLELPYPIRLDRNSGLSFSTSFAAGNMNANLMVGMFFVEE